ncbi:hypothetical protein RBU49_17340 [Clostridium sp. MB40-C1]|uniref:hypothetical protein n=1 Tax=Clostridium sp. MB40-C1 TaxID=3070996 RepID=UPI0027E012DE|nr:hypothetical protein [Clostridium sp. MB40-C1]WMJ80543.1 hypothetical protein RBU49_17340 [Clostridium sp. MB40-C1]
MEKEDYTCQFADQGNINFIIIKNSQSALSHKEYVEESLKLCDKFKGYSNLNMNIIFIHNIIDKEGKKYNDMEEYENKDYKTEEIKLNNNNINVMILKNVINVKQVKSSIKNTKVEESN